MPEAPAQVLLDGGIPGLLSAILQKAKVQQGKELSLLFASPAIQNAAYPNLVIQKEGSSAPSLSEPEIVLIFKVSFICI